MPDCSLIKYLNIVEGSRKDYEKLSCYHYRDSSIGPYSAVYAIKATGGRLSLRMRGLPVGVIVYSMPAAGLELRNIALGGILSNLDRKSRLSFINENIRTISRVIIEPRFRSLGLAKWLVKETIERVDKPVIEALAVMGHINRFFEKAGMTAYEAPLPLRCEQMKEAFELVGISDSDLIDAQRVQQKIESISRKEKLFLDGQIKGFLQCYGKRRNMSPGIERTRFVITKLTERPIYYIKIKPKKDTD